VTAQKLKTSTYIVYQFGTFDVWERGKTANKVSLKGKIVLAPGCVVLKESGALELGFREKKRMCLYAEKKKNRKPGFTGKGYESVGGVRGHRGKRSKSTRKRRSGV